MRDPTDLRSLRDAFGCFATGITVVTACDSAGQPVGVTANSFSSLSLDPPLVLWSIGRHSATFDIFSAASCFVISVLGADAAPLSNRFAMKSAHHIDEVETIRTASGPPAFGGALAVFECETYAQYDGGDHVILVGRVKRFSHIPDPEREGPRPLVYFRGRYGTVSG